MTTPADAVGFLFTLAKKNGVACGTVKDGHVLVFKRDYLRRLVEANDQETLVVFVQRGDVQ